jgi:hypothetical protein
MDMIEGSRDEPKLQKIYEINFGERIVTVFVLDLEKVR